MNINMSSLGKMALGGAVAGMGITTATAAINQGSDSKGLKTGALAAAGMGSMLIGMAAITTLFGNPLQGANLATGLLGTAAVLGAGALFATPGIFLANQD